MTVTIGLTSNARRCIAHRRQQMLHTSQFQSCHSLARLPIPADAPCSVNGSSKSCCWQEDQCEYNDLQSTLGARERLERFTTREGLFFGSSFGHLGQTRSPRQERLHDTRLTCLSHTLLALHINTSLAAHTVAGKGHSTLSKVCRLVYPFVAYRAMPKRSKVGHKRKPLYETTFSSCYDWIHLAGARKEG